MKISEKLYLLLLTFFVAFYFNIIFNYLLLKK